jgi:hypothetical protein
MLQLVTIGQGIETIAGILLHPGKTRLIGGITQQRTCLCRSFHGDWLRNDVKRSGSTAQGNPEVAGSLDRFETAPVALFRRAS